MTEEKKEIETTENGMIRTGVQPIKEIADLISAVAESEIEEDDVYE